MDIGDRQLQIFLDWASSAWVLPIVGALLLLAVSAVIVRPVRWIGLSLFLYACTFGVSSSTPWFNNTLAQPLEGIRYYGRIICIALLAALVVPAMVAGKGWRTRLVLWPAAALLSFQVALSSRLLVDGLIGRGLIGPVVFLLMFGVLAVGVSCWVQTPDQVYTVIRCVAVAGILLILGTFYQLAVRQSAILLNGRLYATTNNPNTLGYISGLTIPAMLALIIRPGERRFFRVFLGVATGVSVVFLLWSGSRGGVLMCAISVGLLLRRHLRQFWLAAIVVGVVVALGVNIWFDISLERLVSIQDTRTEAWLNMLHQFRVSPVFGVGAQEGSLLVQENSLLATAATTGLFGLIPFLVTLGGLVVTLVRLRRARPWLGELTIAADLIGASIIAVLVQSMFDATLTGMFVVPVACLYIYLAVTSYLLEVAHHNAFAEFHYMEGRAAVDPPFEGDAENELVHIGTARRDNVADGINAAWDYGS